MSMLNVSLVEQLGLTLLHFIWQGALIGLLYWLSLALWQPARASTRYNLAVAALFSLGLAPVLTFIQLGAAGTTSADGGLAQSSILLEVLLPSAETSGASGLLIWTVAAWLAGVLVLSLRLALGWHYILRLRRSARRQVLAHLTPLLDQLRQRMSIRQAVDLAVSERVRSPVVVGWLKPLILFPPALISRLPAEQLEMILAHELAHIRRHDHLVNLIQTLIETVLFYHPAVMLVSRRVRIERENACDDLAVAVTGNRLVYVEMLAALERLRLPGARLALGVQDGQILGRIRRLVERARPQRQRGLTLAALLGVLLTSVSAGLWFMPELEPDFEVSANEIAAPGQGTTPEPVGRASSRGEPTGQPPQRALFNLPEFDLPRFEQAPLDRPPASASEAPTNPAADQTNDVEPADAIESVALTATTTRGAAVSTAPRPAPGANLTLEPSAPAPSAPSIDTSAIDPAQSGEWAPLTLAMARPARPEAGPDQSVAPARTERTPPPLRGGELITRVDPDFPLSAQRRAVKGLVELEFIVDRRGQVQSVEVVQESPAGWDFAVAARNAVTQWRFEPYRRGDEPIDRRVRVEFDFDPAEACEVYTGSRLPRC